MTIHCVTPNPAVDVTYRVSTVELHAVNRVEQVTQRPGGKGVNVARLAANDGATVATYGFLGGNAGQQLQDLLNELTPGIQQRWTDTGSETRRTIAVVDQADTTMFNEPGLPVTDADWHHLQASVTAHCRPGDVVTISGSLPAGSNPAHVAQLVSCAREAGAHVIVDTSGPALLEAARAGASVLKPNRDELLEVTGAVDVRTGIEALLKAGGHAVIVSLGADGLILGTAEATFAASLGQTLQGNPTGAGDAVVAALAAGLSSVRSDDLTDGLKRCLPAAVAWSAAAVLSPVAGEIDTATASNLAHDVTIKEL